MSEILSMIEFSRKEMALAFLNAISVAMLLSSELFIGLAGFSWMLHLDEQVTNILYLVSFLITGLFLFRTARHAYRIEQKMALEEQASHQGF